MQNCRRKNFILRDLALQRSMPPRHRGRKEQSQKQANAKDEEGRSAHAWAPPEEAQRRQQKKRTVKWSPVFRRMGLFALMLLVPAFLNYAALSQETKVLAAKGRTISEVHASVLPCSQTSSLGMRLCSHGLSLSLCQTLSACMYRIEGLGPRL